MANKSKTKVTQFDPSDLEREELTHDIETRHDHYTDDSIGDPEGAAARAQYQESALYPDWVFNDFTVATHNIWGKRWEDGKEHLVAQQSTIDTVMRLHDEGMSSFTMIDGMTSLADDSTVATMIDNYTNILEAVGSNFHYAVVKGIGDATTTALAERAYRKHLYTAAFGRVRDVNAELPPYVENLQTQAMEASANAGVWYLVHKAVWEHLQWSNAPKYYVLNDVKLRLVNAAKYIEANHRAVQPVKATATDHKQMAINF